MNKKTLFFLVNSPVWAIVLSFLYVIGFRRLLNSPEGVDFSSNVGYMLHFTVASLAWVFSSFYIFYSYLIPKYWRTNKKKKFWVFASLTVFIIEPTFFTLVYIVLLNIIAPETFAYDLRSLLVMLIPLSGITLFVGALGTLCRNIYDSIANKESRKELEHKNLQSELNTLKSKLNPHLLFNSINNIDSLILTNPELASTLLSKLSDLLRYVVYETEDELVSIKKEISNLNKYIDLETIRLINPDYVTFTSQISNDVLIPPMLFFPFVENGFKHSNLNKEGQKLKISIIENNNKLNFECINTVMTKPKNETNSGVGLNISKKRLELLFPNKYELRIIQENNEFCITLQIDLDR